MNKNTATATVKTPAANFTGDVWMNPVFNGDGTSQLTVGLVRFTPGARTNWHRHANGQLLVCTDGVGLVACRDGTTIRLRGGESVWTPPGQEHWHGGTADTMTWHHAILEEPPPATPPRGQPDPWHGVVGPCRDAGAVYKHLDPSPFHRRRPWPRRW